MIKLLHALFIFSIAMLFAQVAAAASFSFTGNFEFDDDVQFINFSVTSSTTVTLKTLSHAGGTNAAGEIIDAGGFDPILSLFDGNGFFMATNDDYIDLNFINANRLAVSPVGIDPLTGKSHDSFLAIALDPGDYIVAVTQWYNFFRGIYDHFNSGGVGDPITLGFLQEGNPAFRDNFIDAHGYRRTSFWALDILQANEATPVPAPPAILLLASALAGLLGLKKIHTSG